MSDTADNADLLAKRQRAFLLNKFASAEGGELKPKEAGKVPAWAKTLIDLTPDTATRLVEQMMAELLLVLIEKGKSKKVGITPAGREKLDTLAEMVPIEPLEPEKKPRVAQKSPAERTAETVRAKVAALTDGEVVTSSKLGKPGGKNPKPEATAAFEQTVRELVVERKLFEHPGGKYANQPPPTLAEVVRDEVSEKLAEKEGPFRKADLSRPKRGASEDDKQAHADALDKIIGELIREKKLFPHPGGKYGQLPVKVLADEIREEVAGKLPELGDSFRPEDLSQPKADAKKGVKKAHGDALAGVIAELVSRQELHHHPGGKFGKQAFVYPDRELREVYTLDIVWHAPDHTVTKADIELAFPGKGKPDKKKLDANYPHVARFRGQGCFELGAPATRQTLDQLVTSGDLRADGKGEAYTLTNAGAERLKRSRTEFPVLPPVGDPATPDDAAMREKWEAFVLLRLTEATGFTLGESAAFAGGYPKGSKLNEATAWVLYGELAKAGHVTARWNGTAGEYTLTPKGLRYLAGLSFDGFDKLEIKGRALTALLAARGGVTTSPPAGAPPADLEAAVMDIFHRLLRERHANIRMVPIHEVRAEVRAKFGDRAASHEVFDQLLNKFDLAGKVRLVEIDDRSRATTEQLQASVAASSGLLFFIKEGS